MERRAKAEKYWNWKISYGWKYAICIPCYTTRLAISSNGLSRKYSLAANGTGIIQDDVEEMNVGFFVGKIGSARNVWLHVESYVFHTRFISTLMSFCLCCLLEHFHFGHSFCECTHTVHVHNMIYTILHYFALVSKFAKKKMEKTADTVIFS